MGVELQYQGLPPASGLVELVRSLVLTDPDEAQRLQFVPAMLRREPYISQGGAIWDWCRDALIRFPGIEGRHLSLGRAFDKLHYLLSEERRSEGWDGKFRESFDVLIAQAFGWGDEIASNLMATQGRPIWMIGPDAVREIGGCVARIEFVDIAANFDPARMERAGVYKAYYGSDAEYAKEELAWLGDVFNQFQLFFVRAAEADETVVYWID